MSSTFNLRSILVSLMYSKPLINLFFACNRKYNTDHNNYIYHNRFYNRSVKKIIQILIHCGLQETAYLNLLSGKIVMFKDERKLLDCHTKVFCSSLRSHLILSFFSVTTSAAELIYLEDSAESTIPTTKFVFTSTTSKTCIS